MRLIITHGYMISGPASNVHVQNLCRGLVREGHDVHLLCQERKLLAYDPVADHCVVDDGAIERQGEQETLYPGRCAIYNPETGEHLSLYVYDDCPGWWAKSLSNLANEGLDN